MGDRLQSAIGAVTVGYWCCVAWCIATCAWSVLAPWLVLRVLGTWLVGPTLAFLDGLQDLSHPPGLAARSECPRWVPVSVHRGDCLYRTLWVPSSYVMLLIGLCQLYRLYVCQYGVFKLKLILSYLPVQLTYSLPSSPLVSMCCSR